MREGIKIPASLIPPERSIDYCGEVRQILGKPLIIGGISVPPICPAALMELELARNAFYAYPEHCTDRDVAAAIITLQSAWKRGKNGISEEEDILNQSEAITEHYTDLVKWIIVTPLQGFQMRPQLSDAGDKPFLYDGEFFGSVIAAAARALNIGADEVMYCTSLCAVGHAVAQYEASLTGKRCYRPLDQQTLDELTEQAYQRECRGELHPWQIQNPAAYPVSELQRANNPEIEIQLQLEAEKLHGGH